MADVLDYAPAATTAPPERWPLVAMAAFTAAAGSVLLARSCLYGVGHVADERRWQREEAWAWALGQGSGCLLVVAMGWWCARRADRGVMAVRNVLVMDVVAWVMTCAVMVVRALG